jgi:hypothetical protein
MTAANVVTRARVEGLVIVLCALGYLSHAHDIPDLFQMPGVPGPAAFPTVVGVVFALAGLWRFLFGRAAPAEGEGEAEVGAPAAAAASARGLSTRGKFYAMWVVLLGYMATMPHLGFPVATVIALALLFSLLGERRWLVSGGLALGGTAVIYVAFAGLLAVQLPAGVLAPLLK